MVTSSKAAHSIPHRTGIPSLTPIHLSHLPSIHLQAADLSSWENRVTRGIRCLQSQKCLIALCSVFTSLAQQPSTRSYTCQSDVGALHVAWVHRRWSLLKDREKNSLRILLWGTETYVESEKQRGEDEGEKLKGNRVSREKQIKLNGENHKL